ncbi:MAG: hypothetical protein QUS14_16725 [Pyrinomonadaceae bacterium]|nr:hypothetical protein [Pyrinomonadaceae bacterium]
MGLWKSRVIPATEHWLKLGRITADDADVLANCSITEQIAKVFELEQSAIWFAKDLSKSIVYSVAPPGTSQHLSMLAFDVAEFDDATVRRILAEHGWYQTVISDLPHFTYLGITEADLPVHGLKNVEHGGRRFWVPDI